MMCGHAAVLADELQVGREVVVAAGRVDVALAQEGLRGVLLPEERIVAAMTGGNFFLQTFLDSSLCRPPSWCCLTGSER